MDLLIVLVFFKQKTAYEMRISDWSSDVCSSDLRQVLVQAPSSPTQQGCEFRIGTALKRKCSAELMLIARTTEVDDERLGDVHGKLATSVFLNEVQRSEEHTSELQSLMRISYAVFCLKKKT